MEALQRLNKYLRQAERWLRLDAASRGLAVTAGAALLATVLLVLVANSFAFSNASVAAGRVLLFLCLAFAMGFGLLLPWLRVSRRNAARRVERQYPEFEERLLTFAERSSGEADGNPFLELLAADTCRVAESAGSGRLLPGSRNLAFVSAAVASATVLAWLVVSGPGFLGYGASLLWAGPPRAGNQPFYDIEVSPGNRTVRRGSDQLVTARPMGFQVSRVRLLARYHSASKWEQVLMQPEPHGAGYQFLFAGIPETAEYYAEAGGVRSKTYTLSVIDLPVIKKLRVTYHFPGWTGLKDAIEDPGGDLRAVEGTQAEVAVLTDRPLANGMLALDEGSRIPLKPGEGNWLVGPIAMQKDGVYHVAARESGQEIRLSEDFFIEARKETPPSLRITRPARDAKVNPIEEVTVGVEAEDEFALQDVTLHYSVNGGPEKAVPLLSQKGAKKAAGQTTLSLEEFKLVPGDVVSFFASARNPRTTSDTDILFIETQPFEREYSQSQQAGGDGQGGGGGQDNERISARQKEIIAATWNELKAKSRDKSVATEDAKFLSDVQAKLRDQALSLAGRMSSRQLSGANEEFDSFSKDMAAAASDMSAAADKLKTQVWKDALGPEQRALQHLLRAEATFRQIQVAFGSRAGRAGGGGGGGGAARDLESLFDLELDTEKNQYETGKQAASADQRTREVDEALQKLEQLARRQQELAQQRRQQGQSFQQRWQQETLRREAEELQRQMDQLVRGDSQQSSAQGQQAGSQGQQTAGSQAGGAQRSLRAMAGGSAGRQQQVDPRLQRAIESLERATQDMRRAGAPQSGGEQNEAEARRAAERLEEASRLLRGLRGQQSSEQLGDVARSAGTLAEQQRDFAERLRKAYGNQISGNQQLQPDQNRKQAEEFADEQQRMVNEYQRLERQIQDAIRDLAGTQRAVSSKLREALGQAQQDDLASRMRAGADLIRRGFGPYVGLREAPVTQGLENLREQLQQAQAALEKGGAQGENLERALSDVEQLRSQMERFAQGRETSRGGTLGGASSGSGAWDHVYGDGLRGLNDLRRLIPDSPGVWRDVDGLIREMQRLDPRRFSGDPALLDQLVSKVLPGLQQLELELRRKAEESGGQVRTGAGETVPPSYADAVAEYFRRLSKAH